MTGSLITRFAPSPSGLLHLGHAYSAWVGWQAARSVGGRFLLRIEDIDQGRCRADYDAAIVEDLAWLGLDWDGPVLRQSTRLPAYEAALAQLSSLGVIYPCFCSRKAIRAELARLGQAPHGPDGPLYPRTCRALSITEQEERMQRGDPHALRLDVDQATRLTGPLPWHDSEAGLQTARPERLGDVILARRDSPASYHLAVVVDDAAQGITLVTRGRDLFQATHLHRLLQALLGYAVPGYHHHRLITDESGQRLAKRSNSTSLRALRQAGHDPADVLTMIGATTVADLPAHRETSRPVIG